jgi:CelD/BcsL family acetyltransferase involved in cellulose biosynthesis
MSANTIFEAADSTPSLAAFVSAAETMPSKGKSEAGAGFQPPSLQATISIERATAERLSQIAPAWRDLLARACEPNVFMNPAIIGSVNDGVTLPAWRASADGARLLGVWAFSKRRLWQAVWWPRVLVSPAFPHAYLGTPVIDRDQLEPVLDALLDFIASARDLPKFIMLDPIRVDGLTMQTLARALKSRGTEPYIFNESQRPILASQLEAKQYFEKTMSSSSRKKLRQQRRRLEEKGALESKLFTSANDVAGAFDDFLQLEAAGWKGRRGSALLCRRAESDFARGMVEHLAQSGDAAIHALYQAGRPVASQVVLRAGSSAFTWKTAYDEKFSDYSPGMLLLENYTAAFLADKSIALVDSCAFDDRGFMSAWAERQKIAQVLFDPRSRGRVSLRIVAFVHSGFLSLRTLAKKLYALRAG